MNVTHILQRPISTRTHFTWTKIRQQGTKAKSNILQDFKTNKKLDRAKSKKWYICRDQQHI
jgi:hypothetical protein